MVWLTRTLFDVGLLFLYMIIGGFSQRFMGIYEITSDLGFTILFFRSHLGPTLYWNVFFKLVSIVRQHMFPLQFALSEARRLCGVAMASADNHACATGAIDPAMALTFTHEELYEPRKSAFDRGLILSIIFRCYHCKRNVSSPWFDPRTKQRVIYRHPKNLREHQDIFEDYTDIMLEDGLVQGVARQPWATQRMDSSTGTVISYLLSFGTRCDAFYLAKERPPPKTLKSCTLRRTASHISLSSVRVSSSFLQISRPP